MPGSRKNPVTDTSIENLGPAKIQSPVNRLASSGRLDANGCIGFINDSTRIIKDVGLKAFMEHHKSGVEPESFEVAGPREKIYFDPTKVKAALVTAGGLCPGLNDVIRAIVLCLYYNYGVRNILGVKFGYQGLIPEYSHELLPLAPNEVYDIHQLGGTILSSSRGMYPVEEIVDSLERLNINLFFTIGGDGTLRGAHLISEEIKKRGLKIAVVGVPKTIDNDINLVSRSFGFDTAVEAAAEVIQSAHTEATGAPNGIGLVKLMGRESGFIAANAALAQRDVNFVLIPESAFDLEGDGGLFMELEKRLKDRSHAVIVVAEGAGQKFFQDMKTAYDPSGNRRLGDIGVYLTEKIKAYFHGKMEINLKYMDPSYLIRSVPANSGDSIFCGFLGEKAVHAAMAGKTNMLISQWNNYFIHLPIKLAVAKRKKVELEGMLWQSVLSSTGQPPLVARNK